MKFDQTRLDSLVELRPKGQAFIKRRYPNLISQDEDILQDVILRLLKMPDVDNLSAVFFTAVRNRCVDYLRSAARHPTISTEDVNAGAKRNSPHENTESVDGDVHPDERTIHLYPSAEKRYDERSELHEIKSRLRDLSPNRQRCVMGRMLGMTVPQIAEASGLSLNATKKGVERGRKQLEKKLDRVSPKGIND